MSTNLTVNTLSISFSTSAGVPQQTSPAQYFTPATGQRAFTIADAIGALNEQINSTTDPTTAMDSPDVLYNFETASDGIITIDIASTSAITSSSQWDAGATYLQGTWQ